MTVEMSEPIILTDNAKSRISVLAEGTKKLRVYVSGGGCAGFMYGFALEETPNEDDTIIGDRLIIDPLSFQYLVGSKIDYVEDLAGSNFKISNPQAQRTCGCGQSFN